MSDDASSSAPAGLDGIFGTADDKAEFSFDNVAPDGGLSAPFNPGSRSSASSSITASTW